MNLSSSQKDWIYSRISNIGQALTPRAYYGGLEMAYKLRKIFRQFGVSAVLDVGANIGQYRNFLRRKCGYEGLILSFEPSSATFETLKRNARGDARWEVFNYALGSIDEERSLNVMQDPVFNSFLTPRPKSEMPKDDMLNFVERTETVRVRRLDTVLRELGGRPELNRLYLKLDTQGHDLEVLKGCDGELRRVAALQTEVSIKPIYDGMPGYAETVRELQNRGFEVSGFFEVTSDCYLRAIEFDCVAVNSRAIPGLNADKD
jgi:FkbM family methyltransferase